MCGAVAGVLLFFPLWQHPTAEYVQLTQVFAKTAMALGFAVVVTAQVQSQEPLTSWVHMYSVVSAITGKRAQLAGATERAESVAEQVG